MSNTPSKSSAPPEQKYSMDTLDKVSRILNDLAMLPRMPAKATLEHFEALRNAISKVIDRIIQAKFPVEQFAPIIMSYGERVLNEPTHLLWL